MQDSSPITVTVKEARRLSGLSHSLMYDALNSGLIESRKVLGRRLVIYASLERFLLARADNRPPAAFATWPRGDGTLRPAEQAEAS
jgi:hypothetical protein